MNDFQGRAAVEELAKRWALHDSSIRGLTVRSDDRHGVVAQIDCVPRAGSPIAAARIILTGLRRIDFSWYEDDSFYLVSGYKALLDSSGGVYMALYPYDDRDDTPDERDCAVFEATAIRVSFTMK